MYDKKKGELREEQLGSGRRSMGGAHGRTANLQLQHRDQAEKRGQSCVIDADTSKDALVMNK